MVDKKESLDVFPTGDMWHRVRACWREARRRSGLMTVKKGLAPQDQGGSRADTVIAMAIAIGIDSASGARRVTSSVRGLPGMRGMLPTLHERVSATILRVEQAATPATPATPAAWTEATAPRLLAANDRANALLRRATAILADIQKKDAEIAAVLDDYTRERMTVAVESADRLRAPRASRRAPVSAASARGSGGEA
jgi:hypothetical protein